MQDRDLQKSASWGRRAVLGTAVAVAHGLASPAQAADPTSERPQPGDRLVFLVGPKKGQPIRASDLPLGGPQSQAYPADPNGTVRDGSRNRRVARWTRSTAGIDRPPQPAGHKRPVGLEARRGGRDPTDQHLRRQRGGDGTATQDLFWSRVRILFS